VNRRLQCNVERGLSKARALFTQRPAVPRCGGLSPVSKSPRRCSCIYNGVLHTYILRLGPSYQLFAVISRFLGGAKKLEMNVLRWSA
jgi:hypothetical protein